MTKLHKLIATVLGVGYIKGGGTIAAAICCIIWVIVPASYFTGFWQVFITVVTIIVGVWSGNVVDGIWGKDSNKVVIDEVAGMMVTLLFIAVKIKFVVAGFVLFRFFDIAKPLLIKNMELLPKGWGVMADDVLAGIYAHIVLSMLIYYNFLQHI